MNKVLTLLSILIGLNYNSFAIKVERTIFPTEFFENTSTIVSITVTKEGEEGFAKLMETIPAGFEVEELNSSTGNFIYEDGKLRIIWLTMPEGESFKAEYKLIHKDAAVGLHKIDGKFYYVKDGKRSEFKLESSSAKVLKVKESKPPKPLTPIKVMANEKEEEVTEEIAEETTTEVAEEVTEEKVEEVAAEAKEEVVEATETEEVVEVVKEEVKEVAVEPKKEEVVKEEKKEAVTSDLVFKVQIGVFSAEKEASVFGDLPDVHYEMAGKFYKYFSGKFSSEYEARSVIEKAKKNGFPGAFLVKYKDGKRI